MRPADYQCYSGSIDFFSSPQFSPEIEYFIGLISQSLRRYANVVDVRPYDRATYRLNLEQTLSPFHLPQNQEFHSHWPVIEAALQRFNEGVQDGEFTLFQHDELRKLTDESKFDQTFYRSPGIYSFRKRMEHER